MIPKKIHYCWFGDNPKTKEVLAYIENWKKFLPDYEIIEWNQHNYNVEDINIKYVSEAFKENKWAFVTDYVRLDVLNQYGGIYLDTDIEMKKSFDGLLEYKSFIGLESTEALCTAVIGTEPDTEWLKGLLADYSKRSFVLSNKRLDLTPNSKYIFAYMSEKYNLEFSKKIQEVADVTIFPTDYFSPIDYTTKKMTVTENTVAIHHYSGAWKTKKSKNKDFLVFLLSRMIGVKNTENLKKRIKKYGVSSHK